MYNLKHKPCDISKVILNFHFKLADDDENVIVDGDDDVENESCKESKGSTGSDEQNNDKLQNDAATKIQSSYRGYAVRKESKARIDSSKPSLSIEGIEIKLDHHKCVT